jgi:hypothetical protein
MSIASIAIPFRGDRWAVVNNVRECTRDGKCSTNSVCVGCIQPLLISKESDVDIERNIAYLKADADKANAVVRAICAQTGVSPAEFAVAKAARTKAAERTSAPGTGQFNLKGQFSAETVKAVQARSKVLKNGDILTVAGASDDDDETDSSSVGMAADFLNCELSGEAGAGCVHGDCDHVAKATECLNNFANDEAGRAKRRADAGRRVASVRFA